MVNKFTCLILILILILNPYIAFADTPIQGNPTATQEQCIQWMKDRDIEEEFIKLVPYIYEECKKANINPVLVIAQCSLETAYFTSYTFRHYHNPAGIKDRGNTNKYQHYDSYEEGFKAQINHLALYSGNPQEDYYYSSRLDGWVTTVEELSGTWAEDKKYNVKILSIMSQIENYEVEEPKEEVKEEKKIEKKQEKKVNKKSNIIYDILNKSKEHSVGYYKIFEYLK